MLSDIDPPGQDDRETWPDVADLHECLAHTIETNFAEAAHALDIRRLQNRKHLVTASFDDRLRDSRHSKRSVSSIDSVVTEIDEVATGERAARLLQAAAGRETAKVDRHEAEALDHALDEIGRLWVIPGDEDDAAATVLYGPD